MKNYDFDKPISRNGTYSAKWDRYSKDIIPLWVADMDFASPEAIFTAVRERLNHPIFGYQSDFPEVYEAICTWVYERHNWIISEEDILLVPGVVTGFNWAIRSMVQPNDSVIFQTPVYHPFYGISTNNNVQLCTAPLIYSPTGYQIDFEEFETRIQKNTRLFLLCNPHNPVGRVFRREELERLAEICLSHNVIICSDEIHCDLIYPGYKHIPIASISQEIAQNSITLMAPSKTFNIPGLHFSFAIVQNKQIRDRMCEKRNGVIEEPNILAQCAANAAYRDGKEWLDALLNYLDGNKKFVIDFINKNIPEIKAQSPEGTYLAWLDCIDLDLEMNPYDFFLKNAKVALNDGSIFGDDGVGFVRMNFACPRSLLNEALSRMAESVKQAKK